MLLTHLPENSALVRAHVGPTAAWSVEAHLLAIVHDALAVANWQRQGKAGASRPKPLKRPGVADKGITRIGTSKSYTMSDFDAAYLRAREAATDLWEEVADGS